MVYDRSPSSEGVQRDLLPLIEGTVVNTKYGEVKTDHILFVASGAFSNAKPTDLIPEVLFIWRSNYLFLSVVVGPFAYQSRLEAFVQTCKIFKRG